MRGYVYILTNKSLPGLVKIGFSTKDPSMRVAELSNTSVPTPFDLHYEVLVDEPYEIEQSIHSELRTIGVHEGKEFFKLLAPDAVHFVRNFLEATKRGVYLEGTSPSVKCTSCGRWSIDGVCRCNQIQQNTSTNQAQLLQSKVELATPKYELLRGAFTQITKEMGAYVSFDSTWGPVVMLPYGVSTDCLHETWLDEGCAGEAPSPNGCFAIGEFETQHCEIIRVEDIPPNVAERANSICSHAAFHEYAVLALLQNHDDRFMLYQTIMKNPPQVLLLYGGAYGPKHPENMDRLKHLILIGFDSYRMSLISEWMAHAKNLKSITYVDCVFAKDWSGYEIHLAYTHLSRVLLISSHHGDDDALVAAYAELHNLCIEVDGRLIVGTLPETIDLLKAPTIAWHYTPPASFAGQ